jgi:hypothetical protein
MRKILIACTLFCTLFLSEMSAKIINPTVKPHLDGSMLCENLSRTIVLPDSLQGYYNCQVELTKDVQTRTIFIEYHLSFGATKLLTEVKTELTPYLESEDLNNNFTNPNYTFQESVFIGDKMKIELTNFNAPIYSNCYTAETKCDSIAVTRHYLSEICAMCYPFESKNSISVSNDTIQASFFDSLQCNSIVCMAIGFSKSSKTIKAKVNAGTYYLKNTYSSASKGDFLVPVEIGGDGSAISIPIYPEPQEDTLRKISIKACGSGERLEIKGSQLCGDLQLVWTLPEMYRTGYSIVPIINKVDETKRLIVDFELEPTDLEVYTTQFTVDLTGLFTDFDSDNYSLVNEWSLEYHAAVLRFFDPYKTCYEVIKHCNEIDIKQYSIVQNVKCPNSQQEDSFNYEIDGDSIVVYNSPSVILAVCMLDGFRKDTNILKTSVLKNINYELFEGSLPIACQDCVDGLVCPNPACFFASYRFIDKVILSSCLVDLLEENFDYSANFYPNPAEDFIQIKDFKGELTLVNLLGLKTQIAGNELFDISSLTSGVYVLSYQIDGKEFRGKLIVE